MVFTYTVEQSIIAKKIKVEVQEMLTAGKVDFADDTVMTEIREKNQFYRAQDKDQRYHFMNQL